MERGSPRAVAIAAVVLAAVALAGCIDPPPGGVGPFQGLTYEVNPFNGTTLWRVEFPVPLLNGAPHPMVAQLALVEGKAEWDVIEVGGALTLSVVGAGSVRLSATGDDQGGGVPAIEDIHWTHEHLYDGENDHFGRKSLRDHSAEAIRPLVLTVSERLWFGGNCGGIEDYAEGDLSSNGQWTPLQAGASHQMCAIP